MQLLHFTFCWYWNCKYTKNKEEQEKADEYIYNHLTAEEKRNFETRKLRIKVADNSRFIIKILMFILMIVCPLIISYIYNFMNVIY